MTKALTAACDEFVTYDALPGVPVVGGSAGDLVRLDGVQLATEGRTDPDWLRRLALSDPGAARGALRRGGRGLTAGFPPRLLPGAPPRAAPPLSA